MVTVVGLITWIEEMTMVSKVVMGYDQDESGAVAHSSGKAGENGACHSSESCDIYDALHDPHGDGWLDGGDSDNSDQVNTPQWV